MWNHCSQMERCNHSLPSSIYHSLQVEHSPSPLLDFSWPQTTSLALLYHWMRKASWSTTALKNSILQSPLSLIYQTNLWIKSVSGMDGAWWMLSGSTFSSDLGKYAVIIDNTNFIAASENSVYGPQSGLALLFGKWRFWWFRLRHPLGPSHGFPHCRTSTMTYSRTLFLLIVEK